MLYWGLDDELVIVIILLNALSIYVAFDITRISKGAPRAWYLIILAFVVLLMYRALQLYFDLQVPSDLINESEAALSVLAGALLLGGLVMLRSNFERRLDAIEPS